MRIIPIEAHKKFFHFFPGGTKRIKNSATDILTSTTPIMTMSEW